MSSIHLLSCSPQEPRALAERLVAHGFDVSVRPLTGGRGDAVAGPAPPDLWLFVATGDRLRAGELERLTRALASTDGAPCVLLATHLPTPAQTRRLLHAGLDLLLGGESLAHLEAQLEATIRGSSRPSPAAAPTADRELHLDALRSRYDLDALEDSKLVAEGRAAAAADAPLVVHGEGGSGRRFFACAVHAASARAAAPFVDVELGGGADDLERALARARGGTLSCRFIDPLNETGCNRLLDSLARQSRDVRLALRVPPRARSGAEGLRQLSRLERLLEAEVVEVPPLRDRPEAIARLVRRMSGLAPDHGALQALRAHTWPGNVGELLAVLEFARERVKGDALRLEHLPPSLRVEREAPRGAVPPLERVPTPADWTITEADPIHLGLYEHKAILRAIGVSGGNRAQAATLLGLGKSTLYRKLRDYVPPDRARESEA